MRRRPILIAAAAFTALAPALAIGVTPAYAATEQLRLSFDVAPSGQSESGPWTTGCFTDSTTPADNACVRVGAPGAVTRTSRTSGTSTSPAIAFPAPGTGTAMLQITHTTALDPGTADFTISAMVKLTSAQASAGANIIQKGLYSTPGGQWKLQVDNGVPSCRIGGTQSDGAVVGALADSKISILDAGWTFIQCKRRGSVLSITVGNASPVNAPEVATMNIANTANVTVGAKGTGSSNDQFHGAMDNAVFSIG